MIPVGFWKTPLFPWGGVFHVCVSFDCVTTMLGRFMQQQFVIFNNSQVVYAITHLQNRFTGIGRLFFPMDELAFCICR
jgi:hypothetical protein